MEKMESRADKGTTNRRKVVRLCPEEEQRVLLWLSEGMDIKTVAALCQEEMGKKISPGTIVGLWKKHQAKIHFERRKYFARLASGIVDGTSTGEEALDCANIYLLKQNLFECLVDPYKDVKQIELLVKAIKSIVSDKYAGDNNDGKRDGGLTDETLHQIEDAVRLF